MLCPPLGCRLGAFLVPWVWVGLRFLVLIRTPGQTFLVYLCPACCSVPLTWLCFLATGQPRWQGAAGRAAASPESWELRVPHGHSQLLQGSAPGAGRGARGAAPPTATREHLAAPQGAAPSAAAALCLPAGCPAGNRPLHPASIPGRQTAQVPDLGDQAWEHLICGGRREIQPLAI